MARIPKLLLFTTVFATVIASGIANGLVTERWTIPGAVAATPSIHALPMHIEDWDGSTVDLDSELLPKLGDGEVLQRRYVNRINGATLTVFLTGGRTQQIIGAHLPTSCFPGAGYEVAVPTEEWRVARAAGAEGQPAAGAADSFRVETFSKTERAAPLHVRLFWAFATGGHWSVPDSPRFTFAGQRRAYKLYVMRQMQKPREPLDANDPATAFLQALLPELNKTLFGQAASE